MGRSHKKIKNQVLYLTYPPFFITTESDIILTDEKVSDSLLAKKNEWRY